MSDAIDLEARLFYELDRIKIALLALAAGCAATWVSTGSRTLEDAKAEVEELGAYLGEPVTWEDADG